MTDKVQLIKEEIERLKTQNETYLDKEYAESTKWYKHGAYDICNAILSFIDSLPKELASGDLEEEIEKIDDQYPVGIQYIREIAHHFAEWQRKKDQETIELAEDHAMLAGMMSMKEEMMKDAVEATIFSELKDSDGSLFQAKSDRFRMNGVKISDRIKVIPIKLEQQ